MTTPPDNTEGWMMREMIRMMSQAQSEEQSRRMKRVWAERKAKQALSGRLAAKIKCVACDGHGYHVVAPIGDPLING